MTRLASSALGAAFVLAGCMTDVEVGRLEGAAGLGPGDTACKPTLCRNSKRACGDCVDNDEDGLVDADDPECIGPCSDSEATLLGREQPCSNDSCFFGPDCGGGNDEMCSLLTPNGCDCHGCCTVGERAILLGSVDEAGEASCTSETLDDPEACQSCVVDDECLNECASCELCFAGPNGGSSCETGDGCLVPECPEGIESCSSECELSCPSGFACVTGCCFDLR